MQFSIYFFEKNFFLSLDQLTTCSRFSKVEEERRLTEWREGEGRESAHNTLWTQFQQTAAALTQLYRQDAAAAGGGAAGGGEGEAGGGGGAREWQPFQVQLIFTETINFIQALRQN